jgi:DNA (cytosine-5)-methyltransferase 1
VIGDVWDLSAQDLPGHAALAWASSPCQDLSLAGKRGGLASPRSGAFFGFWRLMEALAEDGRAPATIVLENVSGLFTANHGADFARIVLAMADLGYQVGAVEIDAALFTPQSRPRAFIVASRASAGALITDAPSPPFHSPKVVAAAAKLPSPARGAWRWWRLPAPPLRNAALADCLEDDGAPVWRSAAQTESLLHLMTPAQRARLEALRREGGRAVGAGFRRVRQEPAGKRQRLEARFDGLAGCVRTPGGGSSRQFILAIDRGEVRARLMTAREAARLMGLPDSFPLPVAETQALQVIGDGVCVPVARWLGDHLLAPLASLSIAAAKAAA